MADMNTLVKTPVIETTRLALRPVEKADKGLISLYSSDWRVARMTSRIPHPNPPGAVDLFLERVTAPDSTERVWAIDASRSFGAHFVGVMGLSDEGEIGYWLSPFFWGLGIATEALRALTDAAPGLGFGDLKACVFTDNPGSQRVLEKAGFVATDTCRAYCLARDCMVDTILLERRADDG